MHVPSGTQWNLGFLHYLDREAANKVRQEMVVPTKDNTTIKPVRAVDFGALAEKCCSIITWYQVNKLATELHVSISAVWDFKIGWSEQFNAWTIPMLNDQFDTIGVQLRWGDGTKGSIRGSQGGLFIPKVFRQKPGITFVTEGASDTMTAVTMGLNAVGRFNATGSRDYLCSLLKDHTVIILPDNGPAGLAGATQLSADLQTVAASVQMIPIPTTFGDLRTMNTKIGVRPCLSLILKQCKL